MRLHFTILRATLLLSALNSFCLAISRANAELLISNTRGNNVVAFDERNGKFLGDFIPPNSGGLIEPDDLNFGPDGNLYVSSGNTVENSAILRYDGKTGKFIDVFASGGGLARPYGAAFGSDGYLYVSSFLTDQILRYDSKTGAFVDVFAKGNGTSGGLNGPNDLLFGPDGKLYVTTQGSIAKNGKPDFSAGLPSQVLRFDIKTKTSTVFIDKPQPSPNSSGFVSFLGLALGSNNALFVSSFGNDIRRYDLNTGKQIAVLPTNYTGTKPSNNFIGNLTFDKNNTLYTVGFDSKNNNLGAILRYKNAMGNPSPSANKKFIFVPTNDKMLRPVGIVYTSNKLSRPATKLR